MGLTLLTAESVFNEITGASTLAEVLQSVSHQVADGHVSHLRPSPTGFSPLDDVLNGGLRPGDLFVLGGPSGVGKTILSLQMARNVVVSDPEATAMYICFEHDRAHLMTRLLCMESAELGLGEEALTLRRLNAMMVEVAPGAGLIERLCADPIYAPVIDSVNSYADRLHFVKASGLSTTLDQIRLWARRLTSMGPRTFLVIDYLQKIPVDSLTPLQESEVTTLIAQGLKELAMSVGLRILAIAAADRTGLQSKRMQLHDMRGSSAIQYEADIGAVLNNKYHIVSREHIVYNPVQAEAMRNWVVMSIEKNRSGRHSVDIEYHLDASHFHLDPKGRMCEIDLSTTKSRLSSWLQLKRRYRGRNSIHDERGSSALEFAFVAMFLFLLIGGIVDLGGAYHNYIILLNASREGARLYSRLPCKSDNRTALAMAVKAATTTETSGAQGVTLTGNDITLAPDPSGSCPASGANVRVTVKNKYPLLFGRIIGFDTLSINASTDMVFYGTDSAADSQ